MHSFLMFAFVAAAYARPDVGGYNYQEGASPGGGFGAAAGGQPQTPLITKHFYLHSAPEDKEGGGVKHFLLGRPQKNYRVVFIKSPAGNAPKLSAEFAPSEEKTVIYVLAQKEPEINPDDISTPAPTQPSKPEVFFVKYKTPEEAENAQRQIQAQYDALGGSSQFSDEGTAPLSSVVGSLGTSPSQGSPSSAAGVSSNYLPPGANGNYLPPRRF